MQFLKKIFTQFLKDFHMNWNKISRNFLENLTQYFEEFYTILRAFAAVIEKILPNF